MDEAVVRRIATLGRLDLDDEAVRRAARELATILRYFDKLAELDTTDVEPLGSPVDRTNVLAPDVVSPSLDVEATLSNAPQQDGEFFRVPKIHGSTP